VSLRGTTLRRSPLAWAGIAVLAVLIGLAGWTELTHAASLSSGSDMDAYWNAALRLRHGQTLYAPGVSNASDLYRYAPWFAYAWIPLTYLPKGAVLAGWMVLCLGAAIASVAPLLRRGPAGWATLALLLPFQLEGAAFGNVQPILVLVLLWGVERRSGPLWVALGASLKAAPLVLAVVYAGRREWGRAAVSVGLTAVLVAPMLLFDLSGYSTAIGGGQMSLLTISPYLWVVAVAATLEAMWFLSRTRYAWVAGSVALMVALPRFLLYEIGFVLVGLARRLEAKP
jgi:Glycosyltransferase family 87